MVSTVKFKCQTVKGISNFKVNVNTEILKEASGCAINHKLVVKMNLGDPELELIDPTPNVHLLFVHFDKLFFTEKLSNRVVVRWSKRMYSCAGTCSYERGSGFCDIALSEPLLKLRPRKDLVETLLHEMIHAYLFVTSNDRDRDGHGPVFKSHMYRINKSAGLNITIYHDFIAEVKLYQTHVWRCNGRCQLKRPHFGIVRRSMNRAPGPSDYWWTTHRVQCGGNFIKIKEPNIPVTKKVVPKSNVITNYIPTNKITNNVPKKTTNPVLKDYNHNIQSNIKGGMISNNAYFSIKQPSNKPLFNVKDQIVGGNRHRSNSADVVQTLRKVWSNKQIPNKETKEVIMSSSPNLNPNKHKLELHHLENTPAKVKKIDDYFQTASGLLRNIYGEDIKLVKSKDGKKFVAVVDVNLVPCPVCNVKVKKDDINRHLDECLNKDVINKLSKNNVEPTSSQINERKRLKQIVGPIPTIPQFKEVSRFKITNEDIKLELPDSLDSSLVNELFNNQTIKGKSICGTVRPGQVKTGDSQSVVKKLVYNETTDNRKCNNTDTPKYDKVNVNKAENINIKVEPGTSKDIIKFKEQICPCCNRKGIQCLVAHLENCEMLQRTDWQEIEIQEKLNTPIIIDDDDDIFDESLTLNATGTKFPCPCCLKMIEQADMNDHLNLCLK